MKTLLEKIEKKFEIDSTVYNEIEDLIYLLEAARKANDSYIKEILNCRSKIDQYKTICILAGIPEIIVENPNLVCNVDILHEDIAWAKSQILTFKNRK